MNKILIYVIWLQSSSGLKTAEREVKSFLVDCNQTAKRHHIFKKYKNNLTQSGSTQLIPFP